MLRSCQLTSLALRLYTSERLLFFCSEWSESLVNICSLLDNPSWCSPRFWLGLLCLFSISSCMELCVFMMPWFSLEYLILSNTTATSVMTEGCCLANVRPSLNCRLFFYGSIRIMFFTAKPIALCYLFSCLLFKLCLMLGLRLDSLFYGSIRINCWSTTKSIVARYPL